MLNDSFFFNGLVFQAALFGITFQFLQPLVGPYFWSDVHVQSPTETLLAAFLGVHVLTGLPLLLVTRLR